MSKLSRYLGGLSIVVILAGCSVVQTNYVLPERHIKIGLTELTVEVASAAVQQEKGLSGRQFLARDRGMLFVFDKPGNYAFWMQDMNFPLDIIWLNNKKIVGVSANVPPPTAPDARVQTVLPPEEIDMVLEVNAGWFKNNYLRLGDTMEYLP